LLQGVVAASAVFKHIDYEKELDKGNYAPPSIGGAVEFKDVHFTYAESEKKILKGLSFSVQPGQTVALVGGSGGGKSTLVNLIPRFYPLSSGTIKIDGHTLDEYKLDFLRQNIAIVSQNVNLFNSSVADNIAFGLKDVQLHDIEAAAKAANAHEFIEAMPEGYSTLVGENGVLLSGGQRQRLAIARAVLRNSPILILDEATSALDNESEVKVQAALDRVMKNRTTIVIAHRLSTIEHADNILVLEKGEIIERGNHAQLMQAEGQYAKMIQRDFSE
jgi:subfamily B ATP-binding cassette protein MsbA